MKSALLCLLAALYLSGCEQLTQNARHGPENSSTIANTTAHSAVQEKRFVFPGKSGPFPESSVALDTITGKLRKTYSWQDNDHAPKGLPLCSELSEMPQTSFVGAAKSYRGFVYSFDGTRWVKGGQSLRYNPKTQGEEPSSDDQYDPLKLLTKEEKAKAVLTETQIKKVADQFGVSYEDAWEEAKQQGYQLPSKH